MAHKIDDATIEYVGILAKLELSESEKEDAKKDMGRMLDYIDKLNKLDTDGVGPMTHIFPVMNVFREDTVRGSAASYNAAMDGIDDRENTLKNAPEQKNGAFKVPKTVE